MPKRPPLPSQREPDKLTSVGRQARDTRQQRGSPERKAGDQPAQDGKSQHSGLDRLAPMSRGSIRSDVDIMAKSLKSSGFTSEADSKAGLYDPFDGFFIYFDYLSKLFKFFD